MNRTIEPPRLVRVIRNMLDEFQERLSGAGQATRSELVRYLARGLDIDQLKAERVLDDLEEEGIVVRTEQPLDSLTDSSTYKANWAIDPDSSPATLQRIEPDDFESGNGPLHGSQRPNHA